MSANMPLIKINEQLTGINVKTELQITQMQSVIRHSSFVIRHLSFVICHYHISITSDSKLSGCLAFAFTLER